MITKIVNIIPGLRSRVSHFRITVLYSLDPGYQSVLTPPPPTAPIDPQCIDFTVDCYYSQVSSIISLSWHSMSGPGYWLREQVVTSLTSGSWRKRRRWRSWRCPCQPSPSWTPGNCWGSWALAPWGKRRSSARLKRSLADLRGEQKGRSMNGVRMRRWMGVSVRSDAWCAAFQDANKHALFTHRQFFPGQTTSEG